MNEKEGYNNGLYYPYHESVSDGDESCYSYWIASPSAYVARYLCA